MNKLKHRVSVSAKLAEKGPSEEPDPVDPLTLSKNADDWWLSVRYQQIEAGQVLNLLDAFHEKVFATAKTGPVFEPSGLKGEPCLSFDADATLETWGKVSAECTIVLVGQYQQGSGFPEDIVRWGDWAWMAETAGAPTDGFVLTDGGAHQSFRVGSTDFSNSKNVWVLRRGLTESSMFMNHVPHGQKIRRDAYHYEGKFIVGGGATFKASDVLCFNRLLEDSELRGLVRYFKGVANG